MTKVTRYIIGQPEVLDQAKIGQTLQNNNYSVGVLKLPALKQANHITING
jgi:hypothetical protein